MLTQITVVNVHQEKSSVYRQPESSVGMLPYVAIIILRSDSRGQVEITGPICLSGQCQVTYKQSDAFLNRSDFFLLRKLLATGFNLWPGENILGGCILKSFLSKDC